MDDLLLRILGCLLQVNRDHGARAYNRAGRRALKAICTVLIEESGGSAPPASSNGNVVRFRIRGPGSRKD